MGSILAFSCARARHVAAHAGSGTARTRTPSSLCSRSLPACACACACFVCRQFRRPPRAWPPLWLRPWLHPREKPAPRACAPGAMAAWVACALGVWVVAACWVLLTARARNARSVARGARRLPLPRPLADGVRCCSAASEARRARFVRDCAPGRRVNVRLALLRWPAHSSDNPDGVAQVLCAVYSCAVRKRRCCARSLLVERCVPALTTVEAALSVPPAQATLPGLEKRASASCRLRAACSGLNRRG